MSWDWGQLGLGGMVIGACFVTIHYLLKIQTTERTEWRQDIKTLTSQHEKTSKELFERSDKTTKELHDSLKTLHEVTLQELIKSKK